MAALMYIATPAELRWELFFVALLRLEIDNRIINVAARLLEIEQIDQRMAS